MFFKRNDRVKDRIDNNLGIIRYEDKKISKDGFVYRKASLHKFDELYEGNQYKHLPEWEQACNSTDYISIRKRKPRIQYPFAKVLTSRIVGKLVGNKGFPTFKNPEDPDFEQYLKLIIRSSNIVSLLTEPFRRMIVSGSVFVRFAVIEGKFIINSELSKFCYPKFTENGDLESVTVAYVFEDKDDKDEKGKPKKKWYRADYNANSDILYEPANYQNATNWEEIEFEEKSRIDHQLGFVQGEWFRTCVNNQKIDGPSFLEDIETFIDELNYNLSQSSQVIQYNQDPQLVIKGLNEDDLENLIRSSQKAWNLGREGEARFLESNLNAVGVAQEFRNRIRLHIQDIARIILMDPEKMAGYAQSGRALEILHAPMVDLIEELRPSLEPPLLSLLIKMAIVNLLILQEKMPAPVTLNKAFVPENFDFKAEWPPVFEKTLEDLRLKVSVATQAATGKLVSRETLTRWLAKDFEIDNIELELQKIEAEPIINPFGGF